jgi:hypothetical protein
MISLTSQAWRVKAVAGGAFSIAFLLAFLLIPAASADVSTINSAIVTPRVFNDVPGATFSGVNNYPASIVFRESGVSSPFGFADRDVWQFSSDGGASAYQFQNGDYFQASFDLSLDVTAVTPRKEAGFVFHMASENVDLEFIVDSDAHEVVQIGGISFYSFTASNGISYSAGQTIQLGLDYFLDASGKNALQFFANGTASPIFEFGPTVGTGALDIGNGSTLGGYFQIINDPNNAGNGGTATFRNISISGISATPEPSALLLLASGFIGLMLVARR